MAVTSAVPACGPPQLGSEAEKVEHTSRSLTAADIALHWAPIHFQDIEKAPDHGAGGRADFITRFDYDDDWDGSNNWDNLPFFSTPASAYYAVSETSTHWFLSYLFFHPRDWNEDLDLTEHENDFEGLVTAVRKDATQWGHVEAAMTVYHDGWRFYRNPVTAAYLSRGPAAGWDVQNMTFATSGLWGDTVLRPLTTQQRQGHGLTACWTSNPNGTGDPDCGFTNNTSVRYLPSAVYADNPPLPDENNLIVDARYKLIDMMGPEGLWPHRFDSLTVASWQTFSGNTSNGCGDHFNPAVVCEPNAAGTPWASADGGDLHRLFADPPKAFADFFAGWDNADPLKAIGLDATSPMGTTRPFDHVWRPAATNGETDLQAVGATTDRSVAVATRDSRLYLFAKAEGWGAQPLRFSAFDGANWTPYKDVIPGITTEVAPAAASCNGKLFAVVKPATGAQNLSILSKTGTGDPATGWGTWSTVPQAVVYSTPALACRGTSLYVFVQGADNHVYFSSFDSSNQWGAWMEVPGGAITYKAPAATVDPFDGNVLDLVIVGTDGRPYINRLCSTCGDSGWGGWSVHPGWSTVTNQPVALIPDSLGMMMAYQDGGNNRLDIDALTAGQWRGRASPRGHQYTYLAPAGVSYGSNVYLFAVGPFDTQVWMTAAPTTAFAGRGLLLSQGKPTDQISTYNWSEPARAVDGRTDSASNPLFDGHINGTYNSGSVTHTNLGSHPWWLVDLGSVRTIKEVDVWNRTDCCSNRLQEWSISVSNDRIQWTKIFNDSSPFGAGHLTVLNANTAMYNGSIPDGTGGSNAGRMANVASWSGRYVKVEINRSNEYLHLAEVQVWGN